MEIRGIVEKLASVQESFSHDIEVAVNSKLAEYTMEKEAGTVAERVQQIYKLLKAGKINGMQAGKMTNVTSRLGDIKPVIDKTTKAITSTPKKTIPSHLPTPKSMFEGSERAFDVLNKEWAKNIRGGTYGQF